MGINALAAAAILLCGFLVGLAKAGFAGLAMLNTPLLTEAVNANFAVGVSLPVLILGDITVGWRFFGHWDKRVVLTMVPGALLGVIIGTPLLANLSESETLFNRAIGIAALIFATLQLLIEYRRGDATEGPPAPAWVGFLAGTGTGIVSTIAHQGGLVSTLYMVSQHLTKERFVATAMGVYFSLNLMKLVPYIGQGIITGETLMYSLIGAPAVVAGVLLGARLIVKLNPKQFSKMILFMVVAMGLKLVIWPG